jgi:uncharacterized protein
MASPMPQDFRAAIEAYIRAEARPVDKFGHQPRLYALTRVIGSGLVYDDDVVFAAAFIHDLGVFLGHRPEDPLALAGFDHVAAAVAKAPAILERAGFPGHKVGAVIEAIRTHQAQDHPRTLEAAILRDADMLEQLGAIGILRTVAKIGRDTRFLTFADALRVLGRNLKTLPDLLRLPRSQALAASRIESLAAFLTAAELEMGTIRD